MGAVKKTRKTTVITVGVRAEIRVGNFPNTIQKCLQSHRRGQGPFVPTAEWERPQSIWAQWKSPQCPLCAGNCFPVCRWFSELRL